MFQVLGKRFFRFRLSLRNCATCCVLWYLYLHIHEITLVFLKAVGWAHKTLHLLYYAMLYICVIWLYFSGIRWMIISMLVPTQWTRIWICCASQIALIKGAQAQYGGQANYADIAQPRGYKAHRPSRSFQFQPA